MHNIKMHIINEVHVIDAVVNTNTCMLKQKKHHPSLDRKPKGTFLSLLTSVQANACSTSLASHAPPWTAVVIPFVTLLAVASTACDTRRQPPKWIGE